MWDKLTNNHSFWNSSNFFSGTKPGFFGLKRFNGRMKLMSIPIQLMEFNIVHICLLILHVLSIEVRQLSLLKCNETFNLFNCCRPLQYVSIT